MTNWLIVALLALGASRAGRAYAHRWRKRRASLAEGPAGALQPGLQAVQEVSPSERLGIALAYGVTILGWAGLSWLARRHADTDQPGWMLAEWFAHTGRWYVFLGAARFGLSFAGERERGQLAWSRRVLSASAMGLIVVLALVWTTPLYPLLDEGKRDAQGYLRQSTRFESTCGAVALANYLERYGGAAGLTERQVARDCGTTLGGTRYTAIAAAARRHGIADARCQVLSAKDLGHVPLPAIVSISTLPSVRHASLLVALETEKAVFVDPAYGEWSVSRERFNRIVKGKTILFGKSAVPR